MTSYFNSVHPTPTKTSCYPIAHKRKRGNPTLFKRKMRLSQREDEYSNYYKWCNKTPGSAGLGPCHLHFLRRSSKFQNTQLGKNTWIVHALRRGFTLYNFLTSSDRIISYPGPGQVCSTGQVVNTCTCPEPCREFHGSIHIHTCTYMEYMQLASKRKRQEQVNLQH